MDSSTRSSLASRAGRHSLTLPAALAGCLLGAVLATPVHAVDVCEPAARPAATLLFPYVEVDLADPAGRTTLISVNNAGEEATVARLTLWTNMGAPTLGFDLALGAGDVQTINVRNLFAGQLPATNEADLDACSQPVELPPFSPTLLQDLEAWHTGAADSTGMCRGILTGEERLAVGYITVDAMNGCSPHATHPRDFTVHPSGVRYFEESGAGLASNANVLWGDLILLDSAGDAAQAVPAVHVRADAQRLAAPAYTFYNAAGDARAPLPSTYRARFLSGQPAETETSFLVWLDPPSVASFDLGEGFSCEFPTSVMDICQWLRVETFDEAGQPAAETWIDEITPAVRRLRIGEEIEPSSGSGFLETVNESLGGCIIIPTGIAPLQSAVISVLRAEGRFSAAQPAVALDDLCP